MFNQLFYLNKLHKLNIKINKNICLKRYPWGFVSMYEKKNIVNNLKFEESIMNKNSFFKIDNFKINSEKCYKIIYNSYINNVNFLDYRYTSFPLSLTLNYLNQKNKNLNFEGEINLIDILILENTFKNEFIQTNDVKFSDYKEHLWNNLLAGFIGPKNKLFLDNIKTKQILKVLYISDKYYDILEWERDITIPNQKWQVGNINNIIIKK